MQTRFTQTQSNLAVATSVGSSDPIDLRGMGSGMVYQVSGSLATITWHVSSDGETYHAAEDGSATAITSTIGGTKAVPLPSSISGAAFAKAVGDAAGVIHVTTKG